MCGIVGYSGNKLASSVLLVGLKKLEYRGYDSAGIALIDKGELIIKKKEGKIASLEKLMNHSVVSGFTGIGHTRWATHGPADTINAHPHFNRKKNIAVVHNGIIENYLELRKELIDLGYVFVSETDTEVIPHLIEQNMKEGYNPKEAFEKTLHRLEGKFSIAMVCEATPDKVYFGKDGAPLILVKGSAKSHDVFLASDLPAVLPLGKFAYYLQDKQWGYFDKNEISVFDQQGQKIEVEYHKITMRSEETEKGEHPHYMLKEIYEQADIIENILKKRVVKNDIQFEELNLGNNYLSKIGRILIQASGTSWNAGLVGKYYLEQFSQIYTEADFSSEFRYRNPVIGGDSLVVGISQSGETADTIAGLHEAKAKFLKVLSLVNNTHSTMARESDSIIDLMAGPEIGVASTKAYTAQLTNLFLLALYLGKMRLSVPEETLQEQLLELKTIPQKIRQIFKQKEKIESIAKELVGVNDTIFLGRTYNYATALEAALKLKEISYIHASGYAAGEFKHGPIALVSEGIPVVVLAPSGEIRVKTLSNLQEVKVRKGKIISIITEGDDEITELSDHVIEIPQISEALSPILSIVPLQLLSYYTAIHRGCDVDQPRNLAKSVTVE